MAILRNPMDVHRFPMEFLRGLMDSRKNSTGARRSPKDFHWILMHFFEVAYRFSKEARGFPKESDGFLEASLHVPKGAGGSPTESNGFLK
eukprot:5392001-Pyramimonas_sp.AAC.1